MAKEELTQKQEVFVQKYMETMNIRESAEAAGVSIGTGWGWLKNPLVETAIQDEFSKIRARSVITIERTLKELAYVMNSDITDFFDINGFFYTFKDFKKLPPEMTKAIQSFKQNITKEGDVKIELRLHSKMEAIKTAAQHLGLILENLNLTINNNQTNVIDNKTVQVIGFPRMDYDIMEWEAMCKEAERIQSENDIIDIEEEKRAKEDESNE